MKIAVVVVTKCPDVCDYDTGARDAEVNVGNDDVNSDKFTKCRLCAEMFSEPRMLPCLHTFCLRCLHDQLATSRGVVTCPCCGRGFLLPVGGVSELPVNAFYARLTERRRTLLTVDVNDTLQVNDSVTVRLAMCLCSKTLWDRM